MHELIWNVLRVQLRCLRAIHVGISLAGVTVMELPKAKHTSAASWARWFCWVTGLCVCVTLISSELTVDGDGEFCVINQVKFRIWIRIRSKVTRTNHISTVIHPSFSCNGSTIRQATVWAHASFTILCGKSSPKPTYNTPTTQDAQNSTSFHCMAFWAGSSVNVPHYLKCVWSCFYMLHLSQLVS